MGFNRSAKLAGRRATRAHVLQGDKDMVRTQWICGAVAFLVCASLLSGCPRNGSKPVVVSSFKATVRLGEAPFATTFSDLSDKDPNAAPIDTWEWDFGDGTTSTEAQPSHTYTTPGSYTVKLKATSGQTSKSTQAKNFIYVLDPARTQGASAGEEATFAGIPFVWIPAGTFTMGTDNAKIDNWSDADPAHTVKITFGFWMSQFEYTQANYFDLTGENDSTFRLPLQISSDLPAETISWNHAQEIVSKLNDKNDVGLFRLPTEAEWEYACRAGTTTDFYFGDDAFGSPGIRENGWTNELGLASTEIVGQLAPNAWGLYDMHGNVWEWTQDRYAPNYYRNSPKKNPMGPAFGTYRVARGGSWYDQPYNAASVSRRAFLSNSPLPIVGMRIVMQ
jgi:formylglycine-generating enzyme required for sulfatase activity